MRVNWREVASRFTHIDATFVEAVLAFGGRDSKYVVRFYPWWEHPDYIAAIERGGSWGFRGTEEAAGDVTVWPIGLRVFRASECHDVVDWAFVDDHPLLWRYEDEAQIVCNSGFDAEELIARIMQANLPGVVPGNIRPFVGWGERHDAPFTLGPIARTPFNLIRAALEEMDVRIFVPREPQLRERPVALVINGEDYLITDDFEVEVPIFEHKPEYFHPSEQ